MSRTSHWIEAVVLGVLLSVGCGDDDDVGNENNDNGNAPECGNGVVDPGEECDDGATNSDTVADACRTDCRNAWCGDGVLDSGELCEGDDLAGESCESVDASFTGGVLACGTDCTFDVGACATCGNGVVEPGEDCDGPVTATTCADLAAGQHGTVACTAACTFDTSGCHTCGDGTVEPAEECEADSFTSCEDRGFSGGTELCVSCQVVGACEAVCGNGVIEPGEDCDGAALGGESCTTLGYFQGTLTCSPACHFNEVACDACGNGVIDAGEACDSTNVGGATCVSVLGVGFSGVPLCTPQCELDLGACLPPGTCGDGVVDLPTNEQCDTASLGGWTCLNVQPGVFDGGTIACAPNCTLDTSGCTRADPCGNGTLDAAFGEVCDSTDLGGSTCASLGYPGGTLACGPTCVFDLAGCEPLPGCGDGQIDAGEVCDGNDLGSQTCTSLSFVGGTLACTAQCTLDTSGCHDCGDGVRGPGELCDANDFGTDSCQARGYYSGSLGCNATCDAIDETGCTGVCGDSVRNGPELCDDTDLAGQDCTTLGMGFTGGTLACSGTCSGWDVSACVSVVCGNGAMDAGEQCDDANQLSHDGCSACCTVEAPAWVQLSPANRPARRRLHSLEYDPGRDRLVVFGGCLEGGCETHNMNDTWEFDGNDWALRTLAHAPSPRVNHATAYDLAGGRVVLFGGNQWNGSSWVRLGDTWIYDGSDWTEVTPAGSPSPRGSSAMAYDSARDRVVMFGGIDATNLVAETWEFDGSSWLQITTADVPPGRIDTDIMAYDSARGVIVMFGGGTTTAELGDTWEYDGTNWQQRSPAASPNARAGSSLVFDERRGRVLLFGGKDAADVRHNETWEYDGATWTLTLPPSKPEGRYAQACAYDSTRHVLTMFGGVGAVNTGYRNDTWRYQLVDASCSP